MVSSIHKNAIVITISTPHPSVDNESADGIAEAPTLTMAGLKTFVVAWDSSMCSTIRTQTSMHSETMITQQETRNPTHLQLVSDPIILAAIPITREEDVR